MRSRKAGEQTITAADPLPDDLAAILKLHEGSGLAH
jgi:hypothetical protein